MNIEFTDEQLHTILLALGHTAKGTRVRSDELKDDAGKLLKELSQTVDSIAGLRKFAAPMEQLVDERVIATQEIEPPPFTVINPEVKAARSWLKSLIAETLMGD